VNLLLCRIAEFTQATGEFDAHATAVGYSIDSRTIKHCELFFAVKGENLDGHDYVEAALKAGAVGAVVSREQVARFSVKSKLLVVDDPLKQLQSLAACVRRVWAKPVIGITGSTGKTTTKECIAGVLSSRFRLMKSEGNLNNHFGLPLQVLKLLPEHELAVFELGMSHAGEISALSKIAQPNIGVVTNVAPVHLEFFDSLAGIARAKYELIENIPHGGTAVLNADDEYVAQFGRDFRGKVRMYGIQRSADVTAQNLVNHGPDGYEFDVMVDGMREHATMPLVGEHNVYNALAAVCVAVDRGMTPSEAVAALATLKPAEKRGQLSKIGGATVINDCYNSNPKALNAMIDSLAGIPGKRHILVAGEMLELGPTGEELHRASGEHAGDRGIDVVLGVRGLARAIVEGAQSRGAQAEFVESPEAAAEWLARNIQEGDVVLLKASRGVRLERALEAWAAKPAAK
jgi:UDP-N-acetylmuramoyl-tripeptide--D-alanyl-D-alanine ligase